jgi:hypothetical protein
LDFLEMMYAKGKEEAGDEAGKETTASAGAVSN